MTARTVPKRLDEATKMSTHISVSKPTIHMMMQLFEIIISSYTSILVIVCIYICSITNITLIYKVQPTYIYAAAAATSLH